MPEPAYRWALDVGVAVITEKGMDHLFRRSGTFAEGDAGGRIWLTTLYYTLGVHRWTLRGRSYHPRSEIHLTLAAVDENARSPFIDYNAALALRWVDFPWNHRVATTFATGVGISYSDKVFAMDIQRHPDRHRTRWKFDWPLQITLASPRHPRHQLVFFNQHQSGGYIFDRGGVNSHGIAYRYQWRVVSQ